MDPPQKKRRRNQLGTWHTKRDKGTQLYLTMMRKMKWKRRRREIVINLILRPAATIMAMIGKGKTKAGEMEATVALARAMRQVAATTRMTIMEEGTKSFMKTKAKAEVEAKKEADMGAEPPTIAEVEVEMAVG